MSQRSNRPVDWEALVTQNENRLYRAALAILGDSHEAEDAVQDAFVRYLEKAPGDLENPSAWLTRVLVNGCKSRLRLAWRRVGPLPETLPAPGPEEREELEELFSLPRRTGRSSTCTTTRAGPPTRSPKCWASARGRCAPGYSGPGNG